MSAPLMTRPSAAAVPGAMRFGVLDTSDEAQLAEYEHHFYLAYASLADNKLVRLIWNWDDAARRLRARIPYADQLIYTLRDDGGGLAGALAINLNTEADFQGAGFGFAPLPELGRGCEFLNLMTSPRQRRERGRTLLGFASFMRETGCGELVARGFDVAYATCTRRLLPHYRAVGAELLAETTIRGEGRCFLRFAIRELMSPAQGINRDAGRVTISPLPAIRLRAGRRMLPRPLTRRPALLLSGLSHGVV